MVIQEQELPYRIEMWDDQDTRIEELIALVADHAVACAAFAQAVKRRPGKVIILRQKSRCSLIVEDEVLLSPKMRNPTEGAHVNGMSTFEACEHLRGL